MSPDFASFFKWYLALAACGVIALPLAYHFLRFLPDRGYAFTKSLGLLAAGYVFWLLGSLGFLQNNAASLLFAAALVLGAGLALLRRRGIEELRLWLVDHVGEIVALEALFLAAFALMAIGRAYNPEIVATEKPMEFMFINSILRSPAFPPHDAWLSGHAISYYYFGYLLVAALAQVTAVPAATAFNLGLAMLFGLAAVNAAGVLMNLIALARQERARAEMEANPPLLASFWPALLAPVFVLVVGNFYGVLALARANGVLPEARVWAVRYSFGAADPAGATAAPGLRAEKVDLWGWLDLKGIAPTAPPRPAAMQWDPGYWWWFSGARVVHDRNLTGQETEAIDEVPAFSFVLGDMHPHVLALPFVLLAIGLALDWMLWARSLDVDVPLPLDRILLTSVVLGGLVFLNTWDYPIYWFLTILSISLGFALRWGLPTLLAKRNTVFWLALSTAILSFVLYFPWIITFQSQAGGILPNLVYATRFQQTFVMFGPVLLGVTLWAAWLAWRRRSELDWRAGLGAAGAVLGVLLLVVGGMALALNSNPELAAFVDAAIAPLTRAEAARLLLARRLVDSLAILYPLAMIAVVAALMVGALRDSGGAVKQHGGRAVEASQRSPAVMLALALVFTGALLLLGPEFVYLRDNFGSRMNTLFKFYFQAWVLWALAAAFGVWYLTQYAANWVRWTALGLMSLAVAAGLLYTLPALYSKTNHFAGPPTLDGMAFFAKDYPDDWAAVQWLTAHAQPNDVVAEGIGGQYWIEGRFSRISMATGLQTVLGWPGHEGQWRGAYFARVSAREDDIRALYQTRDWAAAETILNRYGVKFIVVSSLETGKYKPAYLVKFEQSLPVAFESGDVRIYVRP
jgi:YYY domain-containing protein